MSTVPFVRLSNDDIDELIERKDAKAIARHIHDAVSTAIEGGFGGQINVATKETHDAGFAYRGPARTCEG